MLTNSEKHKLLLKNKNHYLWNKPYREWTELDCENLMNANGEQPVRTEYQPKTPVKAIFEDGAEKVFMSAAAASRSLGVNVNTIYSRLNPRRCGKNNITEKYPIFKRIQY